MNDADELVRKLHEFADHRDIRDIPFVAITARIGRRRMQMMVGATAVIAVVGTVLTVDGVVRGSQVASPPSRSTAAVTASTTTVPVTSGAAAVRAPASVASKWVVRGSLSSRQDLLQQANTRGLAEAGSYAGAPVTGRPLYLGDTAAGRLAVVLVSSAAVEEPQLVVVAGPSGSPIAHLRIVGNLGETQSTSITRLIQNNGQWFLFTLTDPGLTNLEVSWHPAYGSTGIGVRAWVPVDIRGGVSVITAPGQAVAARVRIGRAPGTPAVSAPVIQDSDDLNDPSFFPVNSPDGTPLPATVKVTARQRERTTWLANQLSAVTGFGVPEMAGTVLWSAGQGASAEVLVSFRLPGGGTVVAYAGTLMAGYGNPQVGLLPVAAESAGLAVTAWHSALVYAPTRPNAAVTASGDGSRP